MSRFSGRLQVVTGSAGSMTGFGVPLPQGGFQSVDAQYAAEERCKIRPREERTDFGEGTQDVVDISDAVEDEPAEDILLESTKDEEPKQTKQTKQPADTEKPKLKNNGELQLDADFDKD